MHSGLEHQHMNHECLKDVWITENPEQTYLVDAIVRLGNEAQPNFQEKCVRMGYQFFFDKFFDFSIHL